MNKHWIGYIIITFIFVILSINYPYFNMQYQRGLLLGKGEFPWGGFSYLVLLTLYYFFIRHKNSL